MRVNRFLLERILRQSLAANLEVFHIGRHLTTEVLVNVEFGKILSQHEAMTAQTGAEAHLWVDDIAWLGVATCPNGQESHIAQVGNPLGKHLADNLQELLAIVLDVLTGLVGIGVGAGATDNLTRVSPLLTIDGAEAFVVTAVDNHVQRTTIRTHHRQTARDKGLVLHRIEARVKAELVVELLGSPSHRVDEMVAGVLHIMSLVVANQRHIT